MNNKATILFPFGGNFHFGELAIDSLIRHSREKLNLIFVVEPMADQQDRDWVKTIPSRWPAHCEVIYNQNRCGYYGTINKAAQRCSTPIGIIFTNDQVASPGWDTELLCWLSPNRFVTGRLVESGASLIADGTIWRRFGYTPDEFKEEAFLKFCQNFKPALPLDVPRHYIPMAFYLDDFKRIGMFIEGKDSMNVSGAYREDFNFFIRSFEADFELVEAQKALTYHFQHGSKRKKALFRRYLNWIYPLGLKHLHRWLNGYVSLYDRLTEIGVKTRVEEICSKLNS